MRSQIATSSDDTQAHGGSRYLPFAFTEHGVVMLSAVLNSERAIRMSIHVVRAFVRMRELLALNQNLTTRVDKLEQGQDRTVSVMEVLVGDIERLADEVQRMKVLPTPAKRRIGFRATQ